MRILGLDVGEKTIGIAVSDPLGWTAQGIKTWRRQGIKNDIQELSNIIADYEIEKIVIGLPLNMNGTEGPSAEKARQMGQTLKEVLPVCEIIFQDERLSTVAAERVLLEGNVSRGKRKKIIDKMAAVYILQGYLDAISKQIH